MLIDVTKQVEVEFVEEKPRMKQLKAIAPVLQQIQANPQMQPTTGSADTTTSCRLTGTNRISSGSFDCRFMDDYAKAEKF